MEILKKSLFFLRNRREPTPPPTTPNPTQPPHPHPHPPPQIKKNNPPTFDYLTNAKNFYKNVNDFEEAYKYAVF